MTVVLFLTTAIGFAPPGTYLVYGYKFCRRHVGGKNRFNKTTTKHPAKCGVFGVNIVNLSFLNFIHCPKDFIGAMDLVAGIGKFLNILSGSFERHAYVFCQLLSRKDGPGK